MEAIGQPPIVPKPMTLNSVGYAEHIVKTNLSLPSATLLGSGFRIIGVEINERPTNDTLSNGLTYAYWNVNLYITDQPFVNDSTTNTDVISHSVVVMETSAAPETTSYDTAEAALTPGQACVVTHYNTTSATTSCAQNSGPSRQLIQMKGNYVAVTPSVPMAFFQIGSTGPVVTISSIRIGGVTNDVLSYQQLLALANSMIA